MKTITLEELKDEHLGETGSPKRDQYEHELKIDIITHRIKQLRNKGKLDQEE